MLNGSLSLVLSSDSGPSWLLRLRENRIQVTGSSDMVVEVGRVRSLLPVPTENRSISLYSLEALLQGKRRSLEAIGGQVVSRCQQLEIIRWRY